LAPQGNPFTHVILRGSSKGPNYAAEHVKACAAKLQKSGLAPRLMIDCSHGNSSKQHIKQMEVGKSIVSHASMKGKLQYALLTFDVS
jgi:3-deoxy-7-phosphoheptulonate synthase